MNRSQMLELLQEMFNTAREDFPAEFYAGCSNELLEQEVQTMRSYLCRLDLDADNL